MWGRGELDQVTPITAAPSLANSADKPLPVGEQRLRLLFRRFFHRGGEEVRKAVSTWVARRLGGRWEIGTICSGTEGPVLVWRAFQEALAELDIPLELQARFSTEIDDAKRKFLRKVLPDLQALYRDAAELRFPRATNVVRLVAEDAFVAAVNHMTAGFPCTDISGLNSHHTSTQARTTLMSAEEAGDRTGDVFHHIVEYLRAHGENIVFVILENVEQILKPEVDKITGAQVAPSNADALCHILSRACDMLVQPFLLDPRMFGALQSRSRVYFLGIPRRELPTDAPDRIVREEMQRLLNLIAGSQLTPLKEHLISKSDPFLRARLDAAVHNAMVALGDPCSAVLATGWGAGTSQVSAFAQGYVPRVGKPEGKRARKERATTPDWPAFHQQLYKKKGLDWTASRLPDLTTLHCYPGLAELRVREFDMLGYHSIGLAPTDEPVCLDVSQSMDKSFPTKGYVAALTPKGRKYVSSEMRLLLGRECLSIQGLHYGDDVDLGQFKDSLLLDLAGNAYDCHCYAAVSFVAFACLALLSER